MQTLNLIGCGRVGKTLARLWTQQGMWCVQDVMTTHLASAQAAVEFVGSGTPVTTLHAMRNAAVWMLATPDAQLSAVADNLAAAHALSPPAIAFHCSGALGVAALAPLAALGWQVASAHCILSFAAPDVALAQFTGTPCALEGDASAQVMLRQAFEVIGARCFDVASENKLLYHAAAVFATNFLPVLQNVAEELWASTGVPAELIPALRASLLRNAVNNITQLGPKAGLTGPAARGDIAAIARQALELQGHDPLMGAAYEALSGLALRMAGHVPDTPGR